MSEEAGQPVEVEEILCSYVWQEHLLPARFHLVADGGEGARAAREELEKAIDQLDEYLDETR